MSHPTGRNAHDARNRERHRTKPPVGVAPLNQRLASAVDLQTQMKQALWHVKGPAFIGLHLPGVAFAEIVLLWMSNVATLVAFAGVRTTAAVLLMAYLIWVTFAAAPNFALWRLNP